MTNGDATESQRVQAPIVVIGAGAAGVMASIFAAAGGGRVLLLERTREGGKKILISGGGRCNVLPSEMDPAQYVSASSPNTVRNLLRSWPLDEQRRFWEDEVGLRLVREAETGKLFPESNRARDVRDRLFDLARRRGVQIRGDAHVVGVEPRDGGWGVRLAGGDTIDACAVVLATGGLSVPQTGSDGGGLEIARRLGHTVHTTYPALTPLTADAPHHAALAGISPVVRVEAPGGKKPFVTQGGFLFTHRGYSGPAVLNVSHLAVQSRLAGTDRQTIYVQWTDKDADAWDRTLREERGTVAGVLRAHLPHRLADTLIEESGVDGGRPLPQLRREERRRLVDVLARHPLPWSGDEGYKKAEVTGGGVALAEVEPRTLASRLHPGLFLCGEILDAFGPIGGYNFLWAWTTGRLAGSGAAAHCRDRSAPHA